MNTYYTILIYIILRTSSYFFDNSLINDVGIKGTFILAIVFTIIEVIIISTPFVFANILNSISTKIYLYYMLMLIVNTIFYFFLAKYINLINIWIIEIIVILIISIIINNKLKGVS